MAMNKQRKILCIVAALAAAGVVADRALLGGSVSGGPQTAAAAPVPATPPAPLAAPTPPTPLAPLAPASAGAGVVSLAAAAAGPTLADRLSRVQDTLVGPAPDAFVASAYWQPRVAEPEPTAAVTPVADFDPRRFARQHPLHAIYNQRGTARAMVDGRALRVGDVVDGVTLEAIDERSVVWAGPGVRFRVTVDGRRR